MKDYTSITEKLVLSPRMEKVHEAILPRLQKWENRENTRCCELDTDGKNPFLDEFMDCVNSKIEPYRKSGVIEQDESDVSSAIHASHRFADQSSDVFLKMYVKPEA